MARPLHRIYYDERGEFGSEDPADPQKTTRILTIMLAPSTDMRRRANTKPPPGGFSCSCSRQLRSLSYCPL